MMIEGRANELPDFQVFRTVIKYCLFIIIVPVFAFFSVKVIFDGVLRLDPVTSSVYSAVVAVIVLHATLGLYIFKAYNETESTPGKALKKD